MGNEMNLSGAEQIEIESRIGELDIRIKSIEQFARTQSYEYFIKAYALTTVHVEIYEKMHEDTNSIDAAIEKLRSERDANTDNLILKVQEFQKNKKALLTNMFLTGVNVMKIKATKRGKHAADALHDKPGGNREKQASICSAWASGKYSDRDLCAEQECAALNMSFSTARKALRNTPEPLSRCAA